MMKAVFRLSIVLSLSIFVMACKTTQPASGSDSLPTRSSAKTTVDTVVDDQVDSSSAQANWRIFPKDMDYSQSKSIDTLILLDKHSVAWVFNAGHNASFEHPVTHETVSLNQYLPENQFLATASVDDKLVQSVELKDGDTVLGVFRFVNQTYSTYATFLPESTLVGRDTGYRDEQGIERLRNQNLIALVFQPTTETEFRTQTGVAKYEGLTLGYVDGPLGNHSKTPYKGTVSLTVDFDEGVISGQVDQRQDGLVKYNWRYTDDDDLPTEKGIQLISQPLLLKKTSIEIQDGVAVFGRYAHDNVAIMDGNKEVSITGYSGALAGPNADEVIGSVGNGEEKIIFGASKVKP